MIEGAIADITQLRQRLHRLLVIDKILETREAMERVVFLTYALFSLDAGVKGFPIQ